MGCYGLLIRAFWVSVYGSYCAALILLTAWRLWQGQLKVVDYTPCGGRFPRHFAVYFKMPEITKYQSCFFFSVFMIFSPFEMTDRCFALEASCLPNTATTFYLKVSSLFQLPWIFSYQPHTMILNHAQARAPTASPLMEYWRRPADSTFLTTIWQVPIAQLRISALIEALSLRLTISSLLTRLFCLSRGERPQQPCVSGYTGELSQQPCVYSTVPKWSECTL